MTPEDVISRAKHLVVVDDGTLCWIGRRKEVYSWLDQHGFARGFAPSRNIEDAVQMAPEDYQRMCQETECLLSTEMAGPDDIVEMALAHGAKLLTIV